METITLEAINISKQYMNGAQALHRVSLKIKCGETLVLIGQSGSGKTTLLRMFNRLDTPNSGDIYIQGQSVTLKDPIQLRRQIGYVQQDGGLLPHWTVERNIGLVPKLLGWELQKIEERINVLLELVGLDPHQYQPRYPIELSGGQRQRIAFARALAANPEIILLDEPFGALDAITRHELQNQFINLKRKLQKTMVLVTHDINEAFRLGDRIAVMKEGELLQVGTEEDLTQKPAHDYITTLLKHRTMEKLS